MKKMAIISLSFWITIISLFPKADTCHLVDLPLLVDHYKEHQTEQPITFWQFIVLHYTYTDHQEKERSEQKHLPLQHHHVECANVIAFELKNFYWHYLPQTFEQNIPFATYQNLYYFKPLKGVFQPPRV